MGLKSILFGKCGEDIASDFLKRNNYKILKRNYRSRLGEVDIVAEDKGVICFIEVKTRHSDRFGEPQEAIFKKKQRQISKAALCYLKENKLMDSRSRFDVLSITYIGQSPKIDLIRDAFDLTNDYLY